MFHNFFNEQQTQEWLEKAVPVLIKNRKWKSGYYGAKVFRSTYVLHEGEYNIGKHIVIVNGCQKEYVEFYIYDSNDWWFGW